MRLYFNSILVPVDFSYTVLNTDYNEYAVLWNCAQVAGPLVNARKFHIIFTSHIIIKIINKISQAREWDLYTEGSVVYLLLLFYIAIIFFYFTIRNIAE